MREASDSRVEEGLGKGCRRPEDAIPSPAIKVKHNHQLEGIYVENVPHRV